MFVLDTNIFVEAYKRYYSFDIAPIFWRSINEKAEKKLVLSIDRIYQEINKYNDNDELKIWINGKFKEFFVSTDSEEVFNAYREVIQWAVNQPQYQDGAKSEFASVADSWLIAYAKAYNYTVVTHEEYKPDIKRKIPIPNVCRAFGIPYINTFEMLRQLNISFR
jgi:predicted nucleic acid-binding protein